MIRTISAPGDSSDVRVSPSVVESANSIDGRETTVTVIFRDGMRADSRTVCFG